MNMLYPTIHTVADIEECLPVFCKMAENVGIKSEDINMEQFEFGISACERETALEWALEHLENAADELDGKYLPELARAVQAAIEILQQNLEPIRREADFERYQEANGVGCDNDEDY